MKLWRQDRCRSMRAWNQFHISCTATSKSRSNCTANYCNHKREPNGSLTILVYTNNKQRVSVVPLYNDWFENELDNVNPYFENKCT